MESLKPTQSCGGRGGMPSTSALRRQRQAAFCGFEATLVYVASSRLATVTVSKQSKI